GSSTTPPTTPSTTTRATTTTTTFSADTTYRATITRTAYGIAHIVADDWGSLGFGQGYAFAQDRACTLIDQVIKVRGERAKWFGAGDNDANIDSDFAYRQLRLHDDADTRFGDQPENIAATVQGYVDGFNEALGAEGPHGWCEGEPWVQPITATDLYAYLSDVLLFASSGVLLGPIATAQPPQPESTEPTTTSADSAFGQVDMKPQLASNGWAIGSALSENGGGMLLANPHFPWEGEKRLWESQLTLTTGELNVYGVSLSGVPGVLIGFNDAVAWTHTVSAGYRMTLYELSLAPGDPTSYVYGDTTKAMTSTDITIDVKEADGTVAPQTRTMWASHYGPMLNLPFGWTTEKAYTMRDANIDNSDALRQFFGMDQAKSMDEFIAVHGEANGIPWVNTIATSADGRAWYADTAATPNLSADAIAGWQQAVDGGGIAKIVLDNGAILLDGSDPINEWVDDPAATRPGIVPFEQQPQLERNDLVFNANDSHWLANPEQLLTGYSPLTGPEAVPQSSRTRMNARLLTDPAVRGDDGKLSLAEVQAAIMSNRALHSELLLPGVLDACDRNELVLVDDVPFSIVEACTALRNWDGTYGVDSRGAALWREYLSLFSGDDRGDKGALYDVGFDPADPVGTPNTPNKNDLALVTNLGVAAKALVAAGFAIDTPLGDMQYDGRAIDARIPLPGGTNLDGAASIVDCCSNPNTLGPKGDPGKRSDTQSFTEKGYPVTRGDSFMMTMEFTSGGPHAEAVLTYGQPDDATSADFIAQTQLFSAGTFRPVLFTAAEIAADSSSAAITVTGPRHN
ncbi:MAG: penicillin acylase family protein, partial [Actinomycetota bacterium]|nr:penicillin acylase family protein [Actinomycetota bacterium]